MKIQDVERRKHSQTANFDSFMELLLVTFVASCVVGLIPILQGSSWVDPSEPPVTTLGEAGLWSVMGEKD